MIYSELGLESLADRRFSRRLCSFYKIINGLALQYLLNYLLAPNMASVALSSKPTIYPLSAVIERYQNSFFPYYILQWNSLDPSIRNLPTITSFKLTILKLN